MGEVIIHTNGYSKHIFQMLTIAAHIVTEKLHQVLTEVANSLDGEIAKSYNSLLGRSTVREYAVEVAEGAPVMYGDGGLALTDASQVYCPESRVRLREENTTLER